MSFRLTAVLPLLAFAIRASCGPQEDVSRTIWSDAVSVFNRGDCRAAEPLAEQVIERAREGRFPDVQADALFMLGECEKQAGQRDLALTYFQRALGVYESVSNKPRMAASLDQLALVWKALGNLGEQRRTYREELQICRDTNDKSCQSMVLLHLSQVDDLDGDLEQGDRDLMAALQMASDCQCQEAIAAIVDYIGTLYRDVRDVKADKFFDFLDQMGRDFQSVRIRARAQTGLGHVKADQHLWHEAIASFDRALALEEQEHDADAQASSHEDLAAAFEGMKEPEGGLSQYRIAYSHWQAVGDDQREIIDRVAAGEILERLGRLPEAVQELARAASLLDRIRATIEGAEGRMEYMKYQAAVPVELSGILATLDREVRDAAEKPQLEVGRTYAEAAFYYAEMVQARSLSEMVASDRRDEISPLPTDLAATEVELRARVAATLHTLTLGAADEHSARRDEYQQAERALHRFITNLRVNPDERVRSYALYMYPQPIRADQLQLATNEVLLEYLVLKSETLVWRLERGKSPHLFHLPLSARRLQERVRELSQLLHASASRRGFVLGSGARGGAASDSLRLAALSSELYEILLSQPLTDVAATQNLIIVPEGVLRTIPFEVFGHKVAGKFHYLAESRTITYYPSATVLAEERLRPIRRSKATPSLLALADPTGETPILDEGRLARAGFKLRPLPGARAEVANIERLFNGQPPDRLLMGRDASKAAIEQMNQQGTLAGFRYIHFATHGLLSGDVPGIREPSLLLAPVEGPIRNSFLSLSDVMRLNLNAELVVLSACETGLGETVPGEGVLGLTRGFLYAGTSSVMVSLWSVNDMSTSTLMERFYMHLLRDRMDKAEALRLARIEQMKVTPDPHDWAPFVLVGQ